MEHRAFPILFEFYQEISGRYQHRSAAAEMLCKDLGIRVIGVDSFDVLGGCLHSSDKRTWDDVVMTVATVAKPEHRGFVIYHELAHHQLRVRERFFVRPWRNPFGGPVTDIEIKEEYWCNAFATAMLFAWAGRSVLWENYEGFFAAGTEEKRGTLEYRIVTRDIYCGRRIHLLNQKHFDSPYLGFAELADDLLRCGANTIASKEKITKLTV